MYVVHPHRMIYLANPRTGSMTLRRFLTDPENFRPDEVEIVSDGKSPGTNHMWGEHHGIDEKVLSLYIDRGYKAVCVMRNPWDHAVSWWQLHKDKHTFEEFITNFDDIVLYTLPEEQPHLVQLMLLYCNTMVDFSEFVSYFESIFRKSIGWMHNSDRKGSYRDLYTPELKAIIDNRYSMDIEACRPHYNFKF